MNFTLKGEGYSSGFCAVNFTPSRWSMALQKFLDPEGAARNKRSETWSAKIMGYEAMNHLYENTTNR